MKFLYVYGYFIIGKHNSTRVRQTFLILASALWFIFIQFYLYDLLTLVSEPISERFAH